MIRYPWLWENATEGKTLLNRLRLKFICINMVFLMGMLCVLLGLILHFTQSNLEAASLRTMQEAVTRPPNAHRPDRPEVRLPYFIVYISPSGGITATDGYYNLSDLDALPQLVEDADDARAPFGVLEEAGLRYLQAATPLGRCIVFADVSSERATLHHLLQACVLAACLSFAVFLLMSWFLARWAVKPVEQTWNQQKQFVADASHELKTPLTVITTNAELLLGDGYDDTARRQFASNILTMARQMHGLVVSLLELARVDQGAAGLTFCKLSYSKLVSDAVLPFEALFFERGLRLTDRVSPDIWVKGSPSHLHQVLDILLDNAQKYAAPNGEVVVTLTRRSRNRCLLSVSNPGTPIPQEALTAIFKRFYRLNKARSMNHSYGLGLSIAQEIVAAHHGKIWAESSSGLNTFFVLLPTTV